MEANLLHPLASAQDPEETTDSLELTDGPGSPIIADMDDTLDGSSRAPRASASASASAAGPRVDQLDYDDSDDEAQQPFLRPARQQSSGGHTATLRRFFPNGLFGATWASSSSSNHNSSTSNGRRNLDEEDVDVDDDLDSLDSATDADLLLPSASSASSMRLIFSKRWGTFITRLLVYVGIGVFFILGWKLVFLPRTTLRRDLARLRHYPMSLFDLERSLFRVPDEAQVREWSRYYTSGVHLAGTNYSQVEWTRNKFEEYGFKTSIATYHTYINYPKDHALRLLGVNGTLKYEAPLREDALPQDPTTMDPNSVPTFHGYSANGNVTAQYVYINYGRQVDFDTIAKRGIDIKGKIVIARYGGLFRGLIVKGAQERGAVGVLLYSDPGDDGEITIYNKYKAYPDGPARNPSSVQRGSVQFLSIAPGDPTTPGWASTENAERVDPSNTIPSIPSIPISYRDILPILQELNGMGLNPNDLDESWRGGLREFDYSVGPSTMDLNLYNLQEYKTTPLWNVIGRIDGVIKDEVVILGNHRDAWIVGGAGDPNSGSAVMIELARAFGELKKQGWKPLRTIILASWDGEEYGLIGSTEWGEEMAQYLNANALVYLNVDVAVSGTHFSAGASPLLNQILTACTKRVAHPDGGYVYDHWLADSDARVEPLGSGSDYTVFLDHLGIPSLDIGFGGDDKAVYQYHSNYDSFAWMDKYGDPTWAYHTTMVKLWSLLALELAEVEVIQFNIGDYSKALVSYFDRIKAKIEDIATASTQLSVDWMSGYYDCSAAAADADSDQVKNCKFVRATDLETGVDLPGFELGWWYIGKSLQNLTAALEDMSIAATTFEAKVQIASREYLADYPWFKSFKKLRLYVRIQALNQQFRRFERHFIYEPGLDGREWYKHVVFAPGIWTGYAGATFPGLDEALDARNITNTKRWLDIITERILSATSVITQT
ncbi:uncharacterized protein V1518DRAFT_425714 [Limtongia smithiae]|uniref:uncharacterized protein n=1 Tax=Limtongia smithiae TaxID=1125753 RepID=UPI0034CF988E